MRRTVAVLAVGSVLALPSASAASETIGQLPPATAFGCPGDISVVQFGLASGPSYSPSSYGVITSWRALAGTGANQTVKLLVLRPDGGNFLTAVQKDVVRTLTTPNVVNTFTGLRLPIEPPQRIGVFKSAASNFLCEFGGVGPADQTGYRQFQPEPPDNTSVGFLGNDGSNRVNAQAVVEPDTDRDVFGDETQDRCLGTPGTANGCPSTVAIDKVKQKGTKKVKVTVTVPGAGTLEVGSASDPALASAAAKTLKVKSTSLSAITKQQLTLTLKLTTPAKTKLSDVGKLKLKVKAVYMPEGGAAGSAIKKKKLRS